MSLPTPEAPAARSTGRRRTTLLFEAAFADGDIFDDDCGAGAHLAPGTRRTIRFGWRRWLGFLDRRASRTTSPSPLPTGSRRSASAPMSTTSRSTMGATSVAMTVTQLYDAARLIAPDRDWGWLKALKTRLQARARPQGPLRAAGAGA